MSDERKIVIDNGSHYCRAGWSDTSSSASSTTTTTTTKAASEDGPRVCVRNLVIKPRSRETNEVFTLVGQVPAQALVGLDAARAPVKSPFESNVVVNFETLETVFDYVFDKVLLGEGGEEGGGGEGMIENEVVLTECVLNPQASRQNAAELLFETYGCPGVHLGPDCTFAYGYNLLRAGNSKNAEFDAKKGVKPTGIVLSMGHSSTSLVPFVGGAPCFEHSLRMRLSGVGVTSYLQNVLELKYSKHLSRKDHPLSGFNLAETIKSKMCFVASDYHAKLRSIQARLLEVPSSSSSSSPRNGLAESFNGELLGDCSCPEVLEMIPELDFNTAVERIQVPEVYFQPSLAGVDQMSVAEALVALSDAVTGKLSLQEHEPLESVLLVGGSSKFRGMSDRLHEELRSQCRVGTSLNVVDAWDPDLDAWRGAAAYANGSLKQKEAFATYVNKREYEELGPNRIFVAT